MRIGLISSRIHENCKTLKEGKKKKNQDKADALFHGDEESGWIEDIYAEGNANGSSGTKNERGGCWYAVKC
jgi:hypothetical protein